MNSAKGDREMSAKKKTTKAAKAKTAYADYPKVQDFTIEDLKDLRAEFESLIETGRDPERLEFLRELGKEAQAHLKAQRTTKAKVKDTEASTDTTDATVAGLTRGELERLCEEMNAVMSIVPPMDADAEDVEERLHAELADLHLADFHKDTDHPEKGVFTEEATASIRRLGISIPGEGKRKAPRVSKKPFASARQVIYRAWMDGEKDPAKLSALVDGSIMLVSVKHYISNWSKGRRLPAGICAEAHNKALGIGVSTESKATPKVKPSARKVKATAKKTAPKVAPKKSVGKTSKKK